LVCGHAHVGDRIIKRLVCRRHIIGTLIGSAAMNAFAFAGRYVTIEPIYMTVAAVTLGIAIPTLIYALTRVGAAIAADVHGRAA